MSIDKVLEEDPYLERDDLFAALEFVAWAAGRLGSSHSATRSCLRDHRLLPRTHAATGPLSSAAVEPSGITTPVVACGTVTVVGTSGNDPLSRVVTPDNPDALPRRDRCSPAIASGEDRLVPHRGVHRASHHRTGAAVPTPQDVLTPLTDNAVFLTITVRDGYEAAAHDFLPELTGLVKSVAFPQPDEDLRCVVGISSSAWDRLFAGDRPAKLHPFAEIVGERHRAPATPGDLFLHLRSRGAYPGFELARRVLDVLGPGAEVVEAVHGFRYYDRRDLLGFVDGTANPLGAAAAASALVGGDDPAFAGGSYLIAQKYLHDLQAWQRKPVEDREAAVGRRMLTNIEIPDDEKATDSHVALTTITDAHGVEHDIVRDNMPFGSLERGEFGTYFVGYSADPAVTETMLRRMFVGEPPGNSDRLLEVSTAVSGGLYFVPPQELLDDPPPLP